MQAPINCFSKSKGELLLLFFFFGGGDGLAESLDILYVFSNLFVHLNAYLSQCQVPVTASLISNVKTKSYVKDSH